MATSRLQDLYQNRVFIKWFIGIASLFIGGFSIFATNLLVENLKERESKIIDLYAKTLEYLVNRADEDDVAFLNEEIIFSNNSIPVILTNSVRVPLDARNIGYPTRVKTDSAKQQYLIAEVARMESLYAPIEIQVKGPNDEILDYNYVFYRNSKLLNWLKYYPYIQLSVIAIFALIVFLGFNYSRVAEQNRVWAGLAKETAHQLGTPISSLMAWGELLKKNEELTDKTVAEELEKDVKRLEVITERFSSIGSVPQLSNIDLTETTRHAVSYLQNRISSKIKIAVTSRPDAIQVAVNRPLYEWVVENLCKNAVDAIGKEGSIHLHLEEQPKDMVSIDIKDTGKGIPKSKINQVFMPGFSTKTRGWGLGLTLAKRIIVNYHKGRIFVKQSIPGEGTTFRILLRR